MLVVGKDRSLMVNDGQIHAPGIYSCLAALYRTQGLILRCSLFLLLMCFLVGFFVLPLLQTALQTKKTV